MSAGAMAQCTVQRAVHDHDDDENDNAHDYYAETYCQHQLLQLVSGHYLLQWRLIALRLELKSSAGKSLLKIKQ